MISMLFGKMTFFSRYLTCNIVLLCLSISMLDTTTALLWPLENCVPRATPLLGATAGGLSSAF